MRIINLFRSLLHIRKLPVVLYLVADVLLSSILLDLIFSFFYGKDVFTECLLFCSATFAISTLATLNPIGEFFMRIRSGCKRIRRADQKQRLEPLFREVCQRAGEKTIFLPPKVRCYITSDTGKNAFALGRRTVCVTKGLLSLPGDQIKAVLAHELGHIVNGDSDLMLLAIRGNALITLVTWVIRLLFLAIRLLANITSFFVMLLIHRPETWLAGNLCSSLSHAVTSLIEAALTLWQRLGLLILMRCSRDNEFKADEFSFRLGYGDALCRMLDSLEESSPTGLFAILAQNHPSTDDRIARLRRLEERKRAREAFPQKDIFTIPEMNRTGSIIYLTEYSPYHLEDGTICKDIDPETQMITALKGCNETAIEHYYNMLDPLLSSDIDICIVPSSNPENLCTGTFLLAQQLCAEGRTDLTFALKRVKPIKKLASGGCRSKDVHFGSIEVTDKNKINGKSILLIDDVTTTGNSLVVCRQLLLEAGAAHVEMLALARTVRKENAASKPKYNLYSVNQA